MSIVNNPKLNNIYEVFVENSPIYGILIVDATEKLEHII